MSNNEAFEYLVCLQEEMRQKDRKEQFEALQIAINLLKSELVKNGK